MKKLFGLALLSLAVVAPAVQAQSADTGSWLVRGRAVHIDSANKDAYNSTTPANELSAWGDRFADVLMLFGGYDQATADTITGLLLPDVLALNPASSDGFVGTLNGRQLAEDVIDFELTVVTNGGIPGDCIDSNDKMFMSDFPYLADPH